MSIQLKIKAKMLSSEASFIRKEEHKIKRQARWLRDHQQSDASEIAYATYWNLNTHRLKKVRFEARATHLARAFLKGFPYALVEEKRLIQYENDFKRNVIPRILAIAQNYSSKIVLEKDIQNWLNSEVPFTNA